MSAAGAAAAPAALDLDNESRSMLEWRSGDISADQMLQRLAPLVRRLSCWVADKYSLTDAADDIAQELRIALVGDAGRKWVPTLCPLSSYLAGWAWRIASGMRASSAHTLDMSFEDLFASAESEVVEFAETAIGARNELLCGSAPEDLVVASQEQWRMQAALAKIPESAVLAALAELSPTKPSIPKERAARSKEERAELRRANAQRMNQRLLDARASLGKTRGEMASAVGIPFFRYVAYETGKSRDIPDELYESVDALLNNARSVVRAADEIKGLSMPEVVQLWQRMLGGVSSNIVSTTLNVSKRTMRRWELNLYTPRHSIVVSYHAKIHQAVRAIRKAHDNNELTI